MELLSASSPQANINVLLEGEILQLSGSHFAALDQCIDDGSMQLSFVSVSNNADPVDGFMSLPEFSRLRIGQGLGDYDLVVFAAKSATVSRYDYALKAAENVKKYHPEAHYHTCYFSDDTMRQWMKRAPFRKWAKQQQQQQQQ